MKELSCCFHCHHCTIFRFLAGAELSTDVLSSPEHTSVFVLSLKCANFQQNELSVQVSKTAYEIKHK